MSKISPAGYRFPEPFAGVQVNFCKNIKCEAFGAPETLNRVRRPKGTSPEAGDYIRTGDSRGNVRMLCGLCGSQNPLRSNEAIAQELGRLAKAPIALEDVLYFEGDSGIARANKKVAPITGTTFNQAQL